MAYPPVIVVSYGGRQGKFAIGVKPSLELADEEIDLAAEELWQSIRRVFQLAIGTRLVLHEAESDRIMSKETFRDPSYIPSFPKFWYLTVDNGYTAPPITNAADFAYHPSLSGEDNYSSMDYNDLLLMKNYDDEEEEEEAMYKSLAELSLGQSPSLDGSREDLTTISMECDESGEFGALLRHFTVIANVLHSENSGSEDSSQNCSRSGSRCSTRSSSDSYDTVRMSTLFVRSVSIGGPADEAGLQNGDIVYSINGQVISGSTTEEIIGLIEDSGSRLILCVSPEHSDDLLFLYPQYVQGEPGEFTRGNSEKILVTDIITKSTDLPSPQQDDDNLFPPIIRKPLRPLSADERILHRIDTYLNSNDSSLQFPKNTSDTSLSSELEGYNSSTDNLLITASLADIPVLPSPLAQRRVFMHNGLVDSEELGFDRSQDWTLSQEENDSRQEEDAVEWFPEADDMRGFTYSLPVATMKNDPSSSMSQSGEFSTVPHLPSSTSNKLARRLKQTLKNLTSSSNSSSSSHRKLTKTSSLGVVQTRSTSALDRIKVSGLTKATSSAALDTGGGAHRSRSTDLGRIKLKDLSLEALTKVNSADSLANVRATRQGEFQASTPPQTNQTKVPSIAFTRPSFSRLHHTVQQPTGLTISTSDSSQYANSGSEPVYSLSSQLSPLEKNLSIESNGSSRASRTSATSGRSYRSQRERLHQTRSRSNLPEDGKEPTSPPVTSPVATTFSRRISRDGDSLSFSRMGAERRHRAAVQRTDEPLLDNGTDPIKRTLSQEQYLFDTRKGSFEVSTGGSYERGNQLARDRQSFNKSPLTRTCSLSNESGGSGTVIDANYHKHSFTASMELPRPQQQQLVQQRKDTAVQLEKVSARRAYSVQPSSFDYSQGGERKDKRRLTSDQLGKFNSVFHGPINKKQERGHGGRKPSERSWKSIYAAIQGHWMVFYATVQDALIGQPLSVEPSLDLRRCVVTVLPRKKNVFRLSFVDGRECLIQAENEESMMRWMRIIHNLNRHIQRLGPLPPHVTQRGSTQDDVVRASKDTHKLKIQRFRTPQPPKKGDKDERSRTILKLMKNFRQSNFARSKEDQVDYPDMTCCNTFGLPLEDCPASYENKSVPLVLMVCLAQLEKNWLDTEGLYRIAGPMGQVRVLAEELNKGRLDLLQDHSDPHVLTGILKKFLKELPNPLIPSDQYNSFISAARDPDLESRTQRLKDLVQNLPPIHYHTLGCLIRHLNKVEARSNVNKMALRNLCLVFGPTVVRKATSEENNTLVADMNHTYTVIEILMTKVDDFFDKISSVAMETVPISTEDLSPPQKLTRSGALKRGLSDPICKENGNSLAQHIPRSSCDESNSRSFLSANPYSQENSIGIDNEYWFSQDSTRQNRPHKKRLARSRLFLTSHDEETPKELSPTITRPSRSSPQLHRHQCSTSDSRRVLQRKISYNVAVEDASLMPGNYDDDDDLLKDDLFNRQGLLDSESGSGLQLSPHHTSYYHIRTGGRQRGTQAVSYSQTHRNRWVSSANSRGGMTEIVGPSSSNNWTSSWTGVAIDKARGPTLTSHFKAPESCL